MTPKIEAITEKFVLGEGPHWDASSQSLYLVDIRGKAIARYVPSTNELSKISVAPKSPSFIIPVEGEENQFVVSLNNELTLISWDGTSGNFTPIETLSIVDILDEFAGNKFNDGKCDSSGRLWAGTLGTTKDAIETMPPVGSIYSYNSKRELGHHVEGIRVANGLAFNDQLKKMYYIDSLEKTIDQFDFDLVEGRIVNRQVLFTLPKHDVPGYPDGMTIDTDGNLWVAIFDGGRVIKISGKEKETLLETIELPAKQVTSVAFGGSNLDELYVTTGSLSLGRDNAPDPSVDGRIYKITGTGSRGYDGVRFKFD